jgi:type II secretory pathway predicted ATPase ExeA/outer membrane protein OmpA-like peptidoglycan-associated protein
LRSNVAEHSVQGQLVGHFGLRENAFGVTPDPRFLFLSHTHGEAMASLVNGIDCDFGFQVLVAQPGMGKTTLLFNFLERFRTTAHTAFLFQPQSNACELLQSVLHELGTNSEETSLRKLSDQLNQVLTRAARDRRRVIVVLDEAQNLDFAVLEALRQLSNFETASSKLMQIVLAGQPQLAKRLALPEQEQIMQRISSFARLKPLALNEAQAYIDHRLTTAGYQGAGLFTPDAIQIIWNHSHGVPRQINTLCFNAMLSAFSEHAKSIDARIVKEASRDLDLNSVLADLYQLDPSEEASTGPRRVQPIRETNAAEADSGTGVNQQPAKVPASVAKDAGVAAVVPPIAGSVSAAVQNVPPAPGVIRAQLGSMLETSMPETPVPQTRVPETQVPETRVPEIKTVALAGKSVLVAQAAAVLPPVAVQVKATALEIKPTVSDVRSGRVSPPAAPKPVQSSLPTAVIDNKVNGNKVANPAKNPAPKTTVPTRPESVMAAVTAPPQKKTAEKKRSESRVWWAKALALAAVTGILAFVLGQQYSAPHSAQVEANGAGGSTQSGYAAPNETPSSAIDNQGVPAKKIQRASSEADSNDDVTVRKFPNDTDNAADTSGKGKKLETIFFAQDSAMIDAQYGSYLRRVADALAENPGASAILEGHTDDSGPETYNLDLSSRRAIAVRNALVDELHVSTSRLAAVGDGAASPAQPNSSATGRAYNRRVEVRLVHLSE